VTTFEVVADPGSNVHALNPLIAGGRVAVGVASEKDVPLVVRTPPFVPALDRPVPPLPIGRVPVTPVVKGRPVTLVITPDAGVPRAGVTRVGDVLRTTEPEPVEVVAPVPPLPIGRVPVTPVVSETFVIVLLEPEMVLFVNVCEAARTTRVSLEPLVSGNVSLSFAVTLLPASVVVKVPPVF